jgi:zinc protease
MSAMPSAELPTASPPVLVETSHALPLVSMTVALRSGASLDPQGKEGLSRLVARLMRRTGGGLSPQVIDTRIDSLGGSLGAEVSHSNIAFHGTVIARSLEPFVDLLADVIARPGFADEELERLKRETEGELIEARDNDRSLARRFFRQKLFVGHAYGRSVSGSVNSMRRVSAGDVRPLYAQTLVGPNLVFAFSGDIEQSAAERVAERIGGALGSADAPLDTVPEPVLPEGRRLVIVDKPERTQTQILIGTLGTHPRDPDHVALHVGNTIFGGTFTARMTREIRSKRGWSYGAYSSLPYDRRRQAFSMWTFPKAEDCAACLGVELEMLRAFRERGVTKKELTWAKRYLVRSHAFAVDTAAKRVALKLDSLVYDLPEGYHEQYIERVRGVTLEEVNQAISARITDRDLLVVVVGTERQIGDPVRGAIDDLGDSEVVAFDTDD